MYIFSPFSQEKDVWSSSSQTKFPDKISLPVGMEPKFTAHYTHHYWAVGCGDKVYSTLDWGEGV